MLLKDFISMEILPFKKWKVTFADGAYVVVDARSNWEAIKIAKPMSRLTTVDARKLTGWEVEILERRMRKNIAKMDRLGLWKQWIKMPLYRRRQFENNFENYVKAVATLKPMKENIAITSEMVKEAKGESSKLLERLSKIDRNSKEARKIRRQLRRLGVSLSKAVSREHLRKKVSEGERRRYIKKSVETPLMTPKERKRAKIWYTTREGLDQVLDTAQVLTQKVGYKSKPELVKRLMEIYPRLTEERASVIADQVLFKKNPPVGATEIYGKIIAIEAQKGPNSTFPKENFRHEFKPGSKIFGLPDGSVLIKGNKKLWKKFKY